MKIKNLLLNISVSIISIIVTILLLELILIIIDYQPLNPYLNDPQFHDLFIRESKNKYIVYELTPNTEGRGWDTDVKINSFGFRDKEYDLEKTGSYRIIALGDSITFGNKLPMSETYPKQLERMFSAEGKDVEVLNMGCGGYNTTQVVNSLQEKGLKFLPDLVVYGFCLNDLTSFGSNHLYINRLKSAKRFLALRLRFFQFILVKSYHLALIERLSEAIDKVSEDIKRQKLGIKDEFSRLISKNEKVIYNNMTKLDALSQRNDIYKPNFFNSFRSLKLIGKMRYDFDKLREMANTNKFKVIIFIIPYLYRTKKNDYAPIHNIVTYEAERNGFTVIDMFDDMDKYGLDKLRLKRGDLIHPNSKGHEIIARKLYECILGLKGDLPQ